MASKQVIDRERSSRTVVAMLTQYADRVGESAGDSLRMFYRKGEKPLEGATFARVLARSLEASTEDLIAADTAHEQELSDDAQVRDERDEAASAAFELVRAIRGAVEATYGDTGLRALAMWSPCPTSPQGTLTYARSLAKALRARDRALPTPRTRHVRLSLEDLAGDLEAAAKKLEQSMAAIAREESEAKGTQARKDAALVAYDETFRSVTSLGVGLFRLAGLHDIADRIKPSTRRGGVLEEPAPEETAPEETTPEPAPAEEVAES